MGGEEVLDGARGHPATVSSPLRVPLVVRLPQEQADAIDRLTRESGRAKRQVVSEVLAARLPQGRAEVAVPSRDAGDDVLTLDEAAALLRVPADAVREAAEAGDLPGRRIGGDWRFVRSAVLAWLAGDAAARAAASRPAAAVAACDAVARLR